MLRLIIMPRALMNVNSKSKHLLLTSMLRTSQAEAKQSLCKYFHNMNSFFLLFCVQFILCYSSADNNNNDVFESTKRETVYICTVKVAKFYFWILEVELVALNSTRFKCFSLASFFYYRFSNMFLFLCLITTT